MQPSDELALLRRALAQASQKRWNAEAALIRARRVEVAARQALDAAERAQNGDRRGGRGEGGADAEG